MRLSVVIPVYNHAEYLAEALHSCLLAPEVAEIVVADDGSIDKSAEVLDFFAHRFPEKIRNVTEGQPTNVGAHNRINDLCSQTTGDWIAILNSDDSFGHGRFRYLDRFAKTTHADLIFGNCYIVDQLSRRIGYKYPVFNCEYPFPELLSADGIAQRNDWLLALLNQNFIATTSNMVFKKALWEELGGMSAYRYVHDWDFLLRAACVSNLRYNPNLWVNYRIHSGNTISENHYKVRAEVQTMFQELLTNKEFEKQSKNFSASHLNASLDENRYLHTKSPIALFSQADPDHPKVRAFSSVFPGAIISSTITNIPSHVEYVYAPSSADAMLNENALRNLALSVAASGYDIATASLTLGEAGSVTGSHLRDTSFVRRSELPSVIGKVQAARGRPLIGRIARLPTDGDAVTSQLVDRIKQPVQLYLHQSEYVLSAEGDGEKVLQSLKTRPKGSFLPEHIAFKPNTDRPAVFVFPGFVAVGGAENIMIEVMKQLKGKYTFIVVCTERLTPAQGTWASRALEHCEAIYELAETCRDTDYHSALALLKTIYSPKCVYITNGTMWQMRNASRVRKLFRDCAIVDQQVYDSKVGWIEWFDHPSVRAADRFIAVNRRIETEFVDRLRLPADKIDMIYHPIDSARVLNTIKTVDKSAVRQRYGVSEDTPAVVFVGRMNDQKRPWLFLDLAKQARLEGRDVQFIMVGQGPLQDEVASRIASEDLTNVIRILNVPKIEELYSVCDMLVIVSEYEGLPLSMLEAMSVGLPIFSTDVGDISPVLREHTGMETVPVEIEPGVLYQDFCSKLDSLEGLKETALEASMDVASRFAGETIAAEYDSCFKRAIDSLKPQRGY